MIVQHSFRDQYASVQTSDREHLEFIEVEKGHVACRLKGFWVMRSFSSLKRQYSFFRQHFAECRSQAVVNLSKREKKKECTFPAVVRGRPTP